MGEEAAQDGGPKCPSCGSDDVAIRGSQSTGAALDPSPGQVWECRKCHGLFAYRPGQQA
jgi:ribosomal protein L37AE/L43A